MRAGRVGSSERPTLASELGCSHKREHEYTSHISTFDLNRDLSRKREEAKCFAALQKSNSCVVMQCNSKTNEDEGLHLPSIAELRQDIQLTASRLLSRSTWSSISVSLPLGQQASAHNV
jgi:hypothetical protein